MLIAAAFTFTGLAQAAPSKPGAAVERVAKASQTSRPSNPDRARVATAFANLPLGFEPNRGQAPARAQFVSHGAGYGLYLTRSAVHLALAGKAAKGKRAGAETLSLSLRGARPSSLSASDRLPGASNYLLGSDRSRWVTGVDSFARVTYRHPWPGMDALLGGRQGSLRYDFLIRPGADPGRIAIGVRGAAARIDRHGRLLLALGSGRQLVQSRPRAYQRIDDQRRRVGARYVLAGRTLRLRLGHYDRSRPLRIDPTLDISEPPHGSGQDFGGGIAVDSSGSAYVAGDTYSPDFPTTSGAFRSAFPGDSPFGDAFVSKLNPTGTALAYSTYVGGAFDAMSGPSIAVDASGSAYITGSTSSPDFPTTPGAFQTALAGDNDAFVAKLNPSGSGLDYSTYLGGAGTEDAGGIAVDSTGSAYVSGSTLSPDFPTTPGAFQTGFAGVRDAYVAKLNPTGSALSYATYLGGSEFDETAHQIAVDASGSAYVTGATASRDFPTTPGAFQTAYGGDGNAYDWDAYVAKLDPSGSGLAYSTYVGGTRQELGRGIAVDSSGSAYITGDTSSPDFPTTPGAFQTTNADRDAYVTKLDPSGTSLDYSSYLGGSGLEFAGGIAIDPAGAAYVTGGTSSPDFPTTPGVFQTSRGDAFATKLDPSGGGLDYSTYVGGSTEDGGIAVDSAGSAYLTGSTFSSDFPTTPGAFQTTYAGGGDAFATKLNPSASALSYSTYLGGGAYMLTVSVRGLGAVTGPGIDCFRFQRGEFTLPDCSEAYARGAEVTLTASPSQGRTFEGWGGGCSGTGACTVTMDTARSVSARFGRAPNTKITNAKIDRRKHKASFAFEAKGHGTATGFQCRLGRVGHTATEFKRCHSPKTYKHLRPGKYAFAVRAVGPGGKDRSPARKQFKIKPAPNTRMTRARINPKSHKAAFNFKAKGEATGFQCRLRRKGHRAKGFGKCKSPKTYKHLKRSKYTFEVRAEGPGGTDPSPAKRKFRIS